MTLEVVRRWFEKLPELERDLPLVILDGVAWTPRAILAEVSRGTPTGERLQALVEAGRLGTSYAEEMALVKYRLREILSRYPPGKPIIAVLSIPTRAMTPEDLLREVEQETQLGKRLIRAELEHMRYLLRLR